MAVSSHNSRALLQLDPWMPEYEGSVEIDPADGGVSGVDATVEEPNWKSIRVSPVEIMPALYFIDGVRRTDARVLAWNEGGLVHGVLGTVAAGTVRSEGRNACFQDCRVGRFLILGAGHKRSATVHVGNTSLEFEGFASATTTPAELGSELQELMRQLEARVAEGAIRDGRLVFIDGPLAYISSLGPVIGVIKRISQPYLDGNRFELVTTLSLGERTPVFLISDGKRDRYSWYQRIGERRNFDHVLTGIVRLELRAVVGIEIAKHLANASAALLPHFSSTGARDPRAPQNLIPIGALETELRRRMGDQLIIRRAIERRIFEGVEL